MNLGLIGYGNIAKKHLEVFRALGCDIVSSSNRSEVGNLMAKTEGGILHTYTDYRKMINSHSLDAIIVCASFDQIFTIAKDLIPMQVPLLLEKPVGTSVRELEKLIELQEIHKTLVQVAYNRRHYNLFHKAITDMGGIQNLTNIQIEWSENPYKVKSQKNYTNEQIALFVYANSIHGIDLMLHIIGAVSEETIYTQDFGGFFRWQMQVCGKSEANVLFNFQSSWDNPVPWRVVLSSHGKRYIFAPLETCKKTDHENVVTEIFPEPYDLTFKAGFYQQAKFFMQVESQKLVYHEHDLQSAMPGMRMAEKLTNAFKYFQSGV